jgi:shikimate kinase
MHHLSLIGFMGCGKSTVGRRLAAAMQRPLCDTDSIIEARAGKSVAAIFADEGEARFRACEHQLLTELLNAPSPSVIVCGGGMPCFSGVLQQLKTRSTTIYLHAPVDVLLPRLQAEAAQRPLLQGKDDLRNFIESLLAQREPFYSQAKHTVRTGGKSVEDIVGEIIGKVGGSR